MRERVIHLEVVGLSVCTVNLEGRCVKTGTNAKKMMI